MEGTDSGQRRACVWLLAVSAEGSLQRICPCLAVQGLMLTQCDVAPVESGSRGALSVLSALPQQTASQTAEPRLPSTHMTFLRALCRIKRERGGKGWGRILLWLGGGGSSSSSSRGESTWRHMLPNAAVGRNRLTAFTPII